MLYFHIGLPAIPVHAVGISIYGPPFVTWPPNTTGDTSASNGQVPCNITLNTQHGRLNTGPYPSHNGKCIKCTDKDHGDSIQNRAAYRKVACVHVFQSGSPFNSKYPMFMLEGVSRLIWNCLTMRTVALLGGGKGVRGRQPPGLNSKWLIAALNWVPRTQPYFFMIFDIWYLISDIWYLITIVELGP